mmetsp:Transcript_18301/g.70707  ORF Transcript_18301/g.70707 Transcript_18301/m.70707 type:complete len:373 (+) Transcript_18301:246-1364(+)
MQLLQQQLAQRGRRPPHVRPERRPRARLLLRTQLCGLEWWCDGFLGELYGTCVQRNDEAEHCEEQGWGLGRIQHLQAGVRELPLGGEPGDERWQHVADGHLCHALFELQFPRQCGGRGRRRNPRHRLQRSARGGVDIHAQQRILRQRRRALLRRLLQRNPRVLRIPEQHRCPGRRRLLQHQHCAGPVQRDAGGQHCDTGWRRDARGALERRGGEQPHVHGQHRQAERWLRTRHRQWDTDGDGRGGGGQHFAECYWGRRSGRGQRQPLPPGRAVCAEQGLQRRCTGVYSVWVSDGDKLYAHGEQRFLRGWGIRGEALACPHARRHLPAQRSQSGRGHVHGGVAVSEQFSTGVPGLRVRGQPRGQRRRALHDDD